MIAMRTYAKKKEHANAPAGPFRMFSHCVYGYNIRNELISAAKNTEHQYQYDELDSLASDGGVAYAYDAAGNRTTKTENGETITYTLGLSDGLASWMSMGSPWMFGQSRDRAWEGKREDGEEDTGADPFDPTRHLLLLVVHGAVRRRNEKAINHIVFDCDSGTCKRGSL